jgi:hypothetical protein
MVYNKTYCKQRKINHISCHAQAHILHTSENSNSCAENKQKVHERKIFTKIYDQLMTKKIMANLIQSE